MESWGHEVEFILMRRFEPTILLNGYKVLAAPCINEIGAEYLYCVVSTHAGRSILGHSCVDSGFSAVAGQPRSTTR